MARSIVARAFRELDQPGVAAELAKTVVLLLRHARALLPDHIANSDSKAVVASVVV